MAAKMNLDMLKVSVPEMGGYSNTPKSKLAGQQRQKVKVNPAILAIVEKHFGKKKKKFVALFQAPAART